MKTKIAALVLSVLFLGSCQLMNPVPAEVNPNGVSLSNLIVQVPSSLSGEGDSRTLDSNQWVAGSVEAYYRFARDQVKIGAVSARFVKNLVAKLESITLASGKKLVGSKISFEHTNTEGTLKTAWSSLGGESYRLEQWSNDNKSLELTLNYRLDSNETTQVSGTMTVNVANTDWALPPTGEKRPDWIQVKFDSSRSGSAWIEIAVQGYRAMADIGETGLQNTIIQLTRDADGGVSAVSQTRVGLSRHFVWNGYTKNESNSEFVNANASAETRYYSFLGRATPENKATVSLALPTAGYAPSTLFTDYAIGKVISQLFYDRIVKNYDFDGAKDTTSDEGLEVLAILKLFDPSIDTLTPASNTPQSLLAALKRTQTALNNAQTPSSIVDFFVDMMQVENPAYFEGQTYKSNGATAPASWLTATQLEGLVPLSQEAVDNLALNYDFGVTPSF